MRIKHHVAIILIGLIFSFANASELISPGSKWHYYDKATPPNSNWNQASYNHSEWPTGYAELGYGDGEESTITSFANDEKNKPITQYFVKSFTINSIQKIDGIKLRLLADDGAKVYLNGKEVMRFNLADNSRHDTLAADSPIESIWVEKSISNTLLKQGKNLVAVEVHQFSNMSSDLSFDLALAYTPVDRADINDAIQLNLHQAQRLSLNQAKAFSKTYKVEVRDDLTSLNISTSGGSGDADLYVRFDELPSLTDWDFRPFLPGNNETVRITNAKKGTYYISLFAYKAFADVQLKVN